ncbi:hypothetical protein V8E53_001979, partial [Lactarius tabidus]
MSPPCPLPQAPTTLHTFPQPPHPLIPMFPFPFPCSPSLSHFPLPIPPCTPPHILLHLLILTSPASPFASSSSQCSPLYVPFPNFPIPILISP